MQRQNRFEIAVWLVALFVIWGVFQIFTQPLSDVANLAYPIDTVTAPAYPPPASETPVGENNNPIALQPPHLGHWVGTAISEGLPTFTPWPSPTPHPFTPAATPRHGVGASWYGTQGERYRSYLGNWANLWVGGPPATPPAPPGLGSDYQFDYVPMVAGGPFRLHFIPTHANLVEWDSDTPHNYWLVFNECEHNWQCDSTPQEVAIFYHDEILRQVYERDFMTRF